MELFTCIGPNGLPLAPKTCFDLFAQLNIRARTQKEKREGGRSEQMYRISFESFDIKDLDERVANIRKRKNTEGCVLYLCDSDANPLAFVKVDSSPLTLVLVFIGDEFCKHFSQTHPPRSKVAPTSSTGACARY